MSWLVFLLRLAPEVRELIVEVVRLIEAGKREEAAILVRHRELGQAAGRAAHKASRQAGRGMR